MKFKIIAFLALFTFLPLTLWGQDSLVVSRTVGKRVNKIDRGIEKQTFIPKGTIFAGGTIGYTNIDSKDFKFLILDNIGASAYMLNAKAMVGYAFMDDVAAGISFDYSRTFVKIDNLDLSLSEDMSFGIKDFESIQQVYTATAFLRTYINIGNSKRFGMFNDVRISFGGGQGKVLNGKGEALVGTYQKVTNVGIMLSPGISVFATDFMAIEASIGIFGLQYSRTDQISNQVYVGSFETIDASFKMNLFSVSLGIAFYF